jgi:ankyrin repeat protein
LYCAARNGHVNIVKWLIAHGASINAMDCGSTPLHAASYYNRPEVVVELLQAGARFDIKNKFNLTAYEEAATEYIRNLFHTVKPLTTPIPKTCQEAINNGLCTFIVTQRNYASQVTSLLCGVISSLHLCL